MNEESKEVTENRQETNGNAMWALPLLMNCFDLVFPQKDFKDNELRERVARLEGQIDMLRR